MTVHAVTVALVIAAATQGASQFGAVEGTLASRGLRVRGAVVALFPHEGAHQSPRDTFVIDQRDLRFVPSVVAGGAGTVVKFVNSDPVLHNVFSPPGPGPGFDLGTYPPPQHRFRIFNETGVHVILCHVHPEMVGYVVVMATPYVKVVEEGGGFRIDSVPAGRYTVRVWHRLGRTSDTTVVVTAGKVVRVVRELVRRR